MSRRAVVVSGVCIWMVGVCLGMGRLWSYDQTAGAPGRPPETWPQESQITLDPSKFTLVLLAHPKCPCTRATVEELSRLMTNCQGRINAYVLFAIPAGVSGFRHGVSSKPPGRQ